MLLNALGAIWCKAVKTEMPHIEAHAYVDDTGPTAQRLATLNSALAATQEYVQLTGQKLNTKKSKGFTTVTRSMHRAFAPNI